MNIYSNAQRINDFDDPRQRNINTSVILSNEDQTGYYNYSFETDYSGDFTLRWDNHGDVDQIIFSINNSIVYFNNTQNPELDYFNFSVSPGTIIQIIVNPSSSSSFWSFKIFGEPSSCVPVTFHSLSTSQNTLCQDDPFNLTIVNMAGSEPINYYWQKREGSEWNDVGSDFYLRVTDPVDGDEYRLRVGNFCSFIDYTNYTLDVLPDPDGDGVCGSDDPCPDEAGLGCLACEDICYQEFNTGLPCSILENTDGDSRPDCTDACPTDPNKWISAGICGCHNIDVDVNNDGVCDTNDGCDDYGDPDGDGVPNCLDNCPDSSIKTEPGICGCDQTDFDADGDGTPDCVDECRLDPLKTDPGDCGCGIPETCNDCTNSSAYLLADDCGPITIIFNEEPCTGVSSTEWSFTPNGLAPQLFPSNDKVLSILPDQIGYYAVTIYYEDGSSQFVSSTYVSSPSAELPPYLITQYDGTCGLEPFIRVSFNSFTNGDRIDIIVEGVGIFEYRIYEGDADFDIPIPSAGIYEVTVRGLEYNCYAAKQTITISDIDCEDCPDAFRCNDDAMSCALFSYLQFEIIDIYKIKASFNSGLDEWMQGNKISEQEVVELLSEYVKFQVDIHPYSDQQSFHLYGNNIEYHDIGLSGITINPTYWEHTITTRFPNLRERELSLHMYGISDNGSIVENASCTSMSPVLKKSLKGGGGNCNDLSYQINNCFPNINVSANIPPEHTATVSILDEKGNWIDGASDQTGSIDKSFILNQEGRYTVTVVVYISFENECNEYIELIDHFPPTNNAVVANPQGEITYQQFKNLIACNGVITELSECIAITYQIGNETFTINIDSCSDSEPEDPCSSITLPPDGATNIQIVATSNGSIVYEADLDVNPATDSDGDGVTNIDEVDIDGDGILNQDETGPSDDLDGDGLVNEIDPDIDNDGLDNDVDDNDYGQSCDDPINSTNGECIAAMLTNAGFSRSPITIKEDVTCSISNPHIVDYAEKTFSIKLHDGLVDICIPNEIIDYIEVFRNSNVYGKTYILDNESFNAELPTNSEIEDLNDQINTLLNNSTGNYIEVYAIISDVNNQDYLFQRHYISGVHEEVGLISFNDTNVVKKSGIVTSPWQALAKFSTASLLDAFFQAMGNWIGRSDVNSFQTAFGSISGASVLVSGFGALVPWKRGIVDCLGEAIVGGIAAVLAGMTDNSYTVDDGVKDFLINLGAGFATCMVAPYVFDKFSDKAVIAEGVESLDNTIKDINVPVATRVFRYLYFKVEQIIFRLPNSVKAWNALFDFPSLRINTGVLDYTKNWGDDLFAKFKTAGTKNPTFYDDVNNFPVVAKYYEEGFPIIKKNNPANKEVELDMFANDRNRPDLPNNTKDPLFDSPTSNSYVYNDTQWKYEPSNITSTPTGKLKRTDINQEIDITGEGLMYVVDEAGVIRIGGRGGNSGFAHPTLVSGVNPNVKCAGMIKIKNGKIVEINRISGHYKPDVSHLDQVKDVFKSRFQANNTETGNWDDVFNYDLP